MPLLKNDSELSLLHSEELLAYLLDGLHEDLNLVKVERKEPLRRLCMPSVHGEVGSGTMRCQAMPILQRRVIERKNRNPKWIQMKRMSGWLRLRAIAFGKAMSRERLQGLRFERRSFRCHHFWGFPAAYSFNVAPGSLSGRRAKNTSLPC